MLSPSANRTYQYVYTHFSSFFTQVNLSEILRSRAAAVFLTHMDSPTNSLSPERRPDLPPRRENLNINNNNSNVSNLASANSALLQHEIDMWSSLAAKTKISKKQIQDDADAILMANAMNKLRDLQKEICETDWMFYSSYG